MQCGFRPGQRTDTGTLDTLNTFRPHADQGQHHVSAPQARFWLGQQAASEHQSSRYPRRPTGSWPASATMATWTTAPHNHSPSQRNITVAHENRPKIKRMPFGRAKLRFLGSNCYRQQIATELRVNLFQIIMLQSQFRELPCR